MPIFPRHLFAKNWHPARAAAAGLIATAAYSVAMETDKYVTGNRFDDVKFIAGLFGKTGRQERGFSLMAWIFHFLNGILLAEVYAAWGKHLLPGPNWLKGALFGQVFILAAWPLTPLADRYHPLIRNGKLPRLANWTSFWQNVLRHFVFGLTLGLLYHERQAIRK